MKLPIHLNMILPLPRREGNEGREVVLNIIILLLLLAQPAYAQPSFDEVKNEWQPSESWLLDRNGEVLHELRVDMQVRRLQWTSLKDISPVLITTLLQAEDKRFYEHHGVDWLALAGATRDYLQGERLRGASTLTMQLSAMLDNDLKSAQGRRSVPEKFSQMLAALKLERKWNKQQILEAYLNLVYFRGELQGIAAATELLFGKHPSGLNQQEAALLVSILPAPAARPEQIARRACTLIPDADCEPIKILAASVFEKPLARSTPVTLAPHLAHQVLIKPGTEVRTTLDIHIQRAVTDALAAQLMSLSQRNVRDGAAIVVDNETGAILAYVASGGPRSTSRRVDGIRALRQAGSTLKPFLYGLALERGYLTAASVLDDTPINLETQTGLYIPQNYDRDFKGPVSVRTALAGSLNVPAVRTLVITGVENFRNRLRDTGYQSITEDGEYYGYSLALGSAEVSLLEQVAAYRTLARGGLYSPLHFVEHKKTSQPEERRVMSADAAWIISDILSDQASRAITFGLGSPLSTRSWSAVKTGTSKDMRDNWCIGYSDRYTVGVWVGNFEGDSMHDVSGISGAAPVWLEIMNTLHERTPSQQSLPPVTVIAEDVHFVPAIEAARNEWFIKGTETEKIVLAGPQTRRGRITSPANGAIIALDPDIPPEYQKIPIRAASVDAGDKIVFNKTETIAADTGQLWQPLPGQYTLQLVSADGAQLDQIKFTVRAPY